MMDAVLLRLGDPRSNCPGDAQLLQQVCSQTRTLLRSKRNVGVAWNFADTTVSTKPGESLYALNVTDFGTPLAVLTVNDFQLPNFVVRRIRIFNPADTFFDYNLPENAGYFIGAWNFYDPNHVAVRATFTWRNNVPYIELLPTGNQQATYSIRYLQSANNVQIAALASMPLQAEDCDLVEVRAAKSLLAVTSWEGLDDAANERKRKNLMVTLSNDEQLAREQFDIAQRITRAPSTSVRWNPCVG